MDEIGTEEDEGKRWRESKAKGKANGRIRETKRGGREGRDRVSV